jgi:uncharacterized protein YbjT (DUF2867 family)
VIAVLGGTGRFGASIVQEFIDEGLRVKILARSPRRAVKRFPGARVLAGTMMNLSHVVRLFDGADAGFLITPAGGNDDAGIELEAAGTVVTAARQTGLPHLIYLSLIQPSTKRTGVPMLDVKGRIETMALSCGLPFSSLRSGCYTEIWLGFFPLFMRFGLYLFPVGQTHRFSFTCQRDLARAAMTLIRRGTVLRGAVDIVDPRPRTLAEVVALHGAATGRPLRPLGRWLLPMLQVLKPFFRWLSPCGASRITLFGYFNENDWVGDPGRLREVLPGFQVTSMEQYLTARGGTGKRPRKPCEWY